MLLIVMGACTGITFAVTAASADEPTPAAVSTTTSIVTTTTSVVITYDSEADLLVTPIDEYTIEVSEPD